MIASLLYLLYTICLCMIMPVALPIAPLAADHFTYMRQDEVSLVILGTLQDGGSPHIACRKDCCRELFGHPDPQRKVVSLGIVDREHQKTFLFEATPDMPVQMKALKEHAGFQEQETPDAIFLTHAHIGHYTGLMYLGKEAMHAGTVPVYAMPRMKLFLEQNGPWSQLVALENIVLRELSEGTEVHVSPIVSVIPIRVPHRDEYSETVGFLIRGPEKTAAFIPDIDKWEKWDVRIDSVIASVDYALVDGSFYDADEIPYRDMSGIPHPFIVESMEMFDKLPLADRRKIWFIHFNHTNPVLDPASLQYKKVIHGGYHIAGINDVLPL